MDLPEHPENEQQVMRVRPLRMAIRNTAAACMGLGVLAVGYWIKWFRFGVPDDAVWWATLLGLCAFAALVCFTHAYLSQRFGPRRAGAFLSVMCWIALAAMLFAVWWSLRPKANGGI